MRLSEPQSFQFFNKELENHKILSFVKGIVSCSVSFSQITMRGTELVPDKCIKWLTFKPVSNQFFRQTHLKNNTEGCVMSNYRVTILRNISHVSF